jgi:hypothetical protein
VASAAYFERLATGRYRATAHVGGAWNEVDQHIAPALGLLAHAVEADRDVRRSDGLVIGRLSYDILGTVPVDVVDVDVRVVRRGRTIELVEASLSHHGRVAVVLRAWLMETRDTTRLAVSALPPIGSPGTMPPWDPTTVWPGGFIASVEVRRTQIEPGRASFWVRTPLPLIDNEPVSRLAAAAGLFDVANGMTVPVSPLDVAFPNIDLTAHLFAEPTGGWVGFDTTASLGRTGLGLTSSVLHDVDGPVGTLSQCLTVRPIRSRTGPATARE